MKQKLLLFFVCVFALSVNAQITINEFLASNDAVIQDNAGEYEDWIELYNAGASSVNLAGYFLTDDLSEPNQWALPDVSIEAKGFLLIWADKDDDQGPLHAELKLSADGEAIGLYDGANYVDSLSFGPQTTDISMGRYPDANPNWYYFSNPSPAETNPEPLTIEQANSPVFSHASGYYSNTFLLELSTDVELAQIHYSLDGSTPTAVSEIYTTAIPIQETTTVRAITVPMNGTPSFPLTKTYLFTTPFDLPVLSIVTAPENLWSESIGIYQNPGMRGEDWERPGSIELINKNSTTIFDSNCGLRIHGNISRQWDKKSLRIYFRQDYGNSSLNCELFSQKENVNSFKRLIIHSAGSDQNTSEIFEEQWTLVRNTVAYDLYRQVGGIYAASRPVAVYLNGEPWGIYNLSERIDDIFTETNFGESNIDLIENTGGVKEGDAEAWKELMNYIQYRNLHNPIYYEEVARQIDIENLVDYFLTQIWIANTDYHGNILMYRPQKTDAVWKYILWDADQAMLNHHQDHNTLDWIINKFENLFTLKKLLENSDFETYFINRALDLLNTNFSTTEVTKIINQMANKLQADIDFECARWSASSTVWGNNIIDLKSFAEKRPNNVRTHFVDYFDLGRLYQLSLEAPHQIHGTVDLNTLTLYNFPWTGTYATNQPLTLEAIPDPGYMFVGWSDPSLQQDSQITIQPTDDYSLYPIFAETVISYPVTINEINYNSSDAFDPGDWVELHNYGTEAVDISDWHFKDSDDDHDFILPAGTTIPANDFLVLAENLGDFQGQFPTVTNVIGSFDFGLSGGGELIRLYDAAGNMVDSLEYDDKAPWPTEPDGDGPTLELISPQLDNTLAASWEASDGNGSPGLANDLPTQPILSVTPTSLTFTTQLGGADPAALQIGVTNAGVGSLNWSATEQPETAWLTITTSANAVTVQAAIAGLAAGSYDAVIQISSTNAPNSPVEVAVQLTVSEILAGNEVILAEFEAESSANLPNAGWQMTTNAGESCIKPIKNSDLEPLDENRLDYTFSVPAGISEVYVFAEVDVNNNYRHDSFWVEFNHADRCKWDNLKQLCQDGWKRAWIFNVNQENQHTFTTTTGTNVISFFPHTDGAFLNWLVVTTDPNYDIKNHTFGETTPLEPPTEPVISVNLASVNFNAQIGGDNPAAQQISISNTGGGSLTWSATELPETAWLTLTPAANSVSAQANISGLAVGTYNSKIQISSTTATNSPVEISVQLTISDTLPVNDIIIAEFQAESSGDLPNSGWQVTKNDGENCIKPLTSSLQEPAENNRLDYVFSVPAGISEIYVFAEVDVNNNYRHDSFWVEFNNADRCLWDNLKPLCQDGWKRAWVFDVDKENQHQFTPNIGNNVISFFPHTDGAFLNWLVVTTDPSYDIENHVVGDGGSIPPPTDPQITISPSSLNFSTQLGGGNPATQQINISNGGGGTLTWNAAESPETAWLSLNVAANSISVQANTNGLAAGTYNSTISISSANATNSPVEIPVKLTITQNLPPDQSIIAEFQAEHNPGLPTPGWQTWVNDGDSCLKAIPATAPEPLDEYRLDYKFYVPFGITTFYVFAEVDVNNNYRKDSFWVDVNDEDLCHWDNLKPICRDGWKRAWVFDADNDSQHPFAAVPDTNILSIYPESEGPFINWLVVTTDPDFDIVNYTPTAAMAKGNFPAGDAASTPSSLPEYYHLAQNYPNPFNPETCIDFDLPETATVSLEIFNLTGQRIALLYHGELAAGHHSVRWNTTNLENPIIPSGVYLCRFKAGAAEQIIRMMLLK